MRGIPVCAALVVLSCASGRAPVPEPAAPAPPAPVPEVLEVEPLGLHRIERALVLGTGAGGASTVVPLADAPAEVTLAAAFVRAGEPPTGAASQLALRAALADDGGVTVTGASDAPAWRSAAWAAAREAGALLAREPADIALTVRPPDYADGPSAGALLAGGALAGLLGLTVDGDVTVVGTVNPDGTIGPVGGIGERYAAASKAGVVRFGYPAGQPVTITGQPIADVRDAVALLTGERLPATLPVEADAMALDAERARLIEQQYASWRRSLGLLWDTVLAVKTGRRRPPVVVELADRAQWAGTAAEKLVREQRPAPAYARVLEATAAAQAVSYIVEILDKIHAGDIDGARFLVDAHFQSDDAARAVLAKLAVREPATIDEALALVAAHALAIEGLALRRWSVERVAGIRAALDEVAALPRKQRDEPEIADRVATAIAGPLAAAARADVCGRAAIDALELAQPGAASYRMSAEAARRLALADAAAADATLAHFEAHAPKPLLAGPGGLVAPGYAAARGALKLLDADGDDTAAELREAWGADSATWALYAFAGARRARLDANVLAATWMSLGVERNLTTGRTEGVRESLALQTLVHTAERKAREHAAAARVAIGYVPIQARVHYQTAMALREGGTADRLAALEHLWRSSTWSRTAITLARHRQRE